MDYPALKAEVLLPAYVGMTDAQIAAALNAASVVVHVDVQVADVEGYLALNGRISALQAWVDANTTASAARTAGLELLGLLQRSRVQAFATSDPATLAGVQAMFGALVAAGAGGITQNDEAALFAGASVMVSRASQLGFGGLTDEAVMGHIAAARIWG